MRKNKSFFRSLSGILAMLLFLALIPALTACGNRPSQEEILSISRELIEKSIPVNEIVFGAGMALDETSNEYLAYTLRGENSAEVFYIPVAADAPCQDEASLSALFESVYSADYCDYLRQLCFTGISNGAGAIASYARYITLEDRLALRADSAVITQGRTLDLSTLQVVSIRKNRAVVSVAVHSEILGDSRDEFVLVRQETESGSVWRLDTPTY